MTLISMQQGAAGLIKRRSIVSGSTVRNRPIIKDGTVMSAEGTLLRGGTMGLDEPGSLASNYTTDLFRWEQFRSFKFNIVRVPFSISLVNVSLNQQLADMDKVVENAGKTGMYVMFVLDSPYGIANYQENINIWPTVCQRYANNTNVIFEMGNEWHWDAGEHDDAQLDLIYQIYTLMHTAAPNSLIGLFTPASVSTSTGILNAINGLKNRGTVFGSVGKAFVSFHAYGNYSALAIQQMRNAAPVMMTETAWHGGGTEDEVYKINEMEKMPGGKISWQVLNVRFGELSNEDGFYSNTLEALTERILPDIYDIHGITWDADQIAPLVRALPAGGQFANRVSFAPGGARITAPGAIAGRSFAASVSFAKGAAVGTTVTVPVTKTITFTPANPGTLNETAAGAGAQWNTTIGLQNISSVTWAIIQANGTQRGPSNIIAANASLNITATFLATGEKIRAWETGNTAVNKDSGAVTLAAATRSITLSPNDPGVVPYQYAIVPTTVNTKGITNFTFVVINADGGWTSSGFQRQVNPVGDSVTLDIIYGFDGQKLVVFDTNDASFRVTGGAATIATTPPVTGVGVYEGFNNNTTGLLNHIWGNRNQLSINGGIIRLQGLPGLDPWANACGVMMFPSGPSAGYGYGLFEMRIRAADFLGDGQGSAALLWPGDDIWPGCEEDLHEVNREGRAYSTHHFRGPPDANGDPTDRFEYFIKPNHDPTQWHTAACRIKRDYLEFLTNGVVFASTTDNVTRAFGDGPNGCNRVFGIMNRDSQTWIELDWVKHTPEDP